MSRLVLALPSKGRLQEQVSSFLADCGMSIAQEAGSRGYSARIAALPEAEVRLLSAGEIARALRDGEVHVGVTGEDLLREIDPQLTRVALVKALGFGRADLVVAAPQSWIDVDTMADLEAVCVEHRARTGRRLRVATKYLAQAAAFFEARGLDDYRIVESLGATEGAPSAGAAEVIVDITTTGQTLAANHLKVIRDGVILRSQAQLAAARSAVWSDTALAAFSFFLDAVEARARGKALRILRAPVGASGAADMVRRAEAAGCRLVGRAADDVLEFHCPAALVFRASVALQAAAGGPVAVLSADYLYELPNTVFDKFATAVGVDA